MNKDNVLTIPAGLAEAKTNKSKFVLGGVIIVLAIAYLIYTAIQSTSLYYFTIGELYDQGTAIAAQQVRVSGMVDEPTIDFNSKELILKFEIMGENGERLPVVFNGPKPDQMREGAEAILQGSFDGEMFTAQELLLKCPSRYDDGTLEEVQVEAVR